MRHVERFLFILAVLDTLSCRKRKRMKKGVTNQCWEIFVLSVPAIYEHDLMYNVVLEVEHVN